MSANRVDPMESWGRVRVDALELQDPYHRTDPEPLTEARQIAKMRALMTNNRKIVTSGQFDGNSVFQQFKEVERILSEAEMCDRAQEFLLAKELYAICSSLRCEIATDAQGQISPGDPAAVQVRRAHAQRGVQGTSPRKQN
jgi:hypothetical protein